jgi:D-psicose/D-tagatose/L-ribulose 3-epimerase
MSKKKISGVLAVCSWIYGDEPLERLLERIARLGYEGIELSGEPARYNINELQRLLNEYHLTVPFLTASCDWPTEERDLANPSAKVRARAVAHFKACVDLADALDTPGVGLIPQACGRFRPLDNFRTEWNYAVEATRQVAQYAETKGVWVAVEALNRYEAFLVTNHRQAMDFVAAVGAPNVGVLLDTFHMNMEESDMPAAIKATGSRLYHFHLADSNREGLRHGHLDLAAVFATLQRIDYEGSFGLEVTAPGPDPYADIKDHQSREFLDQYLQESLSVFRGLARQFAGDYPSVSPVLGRGY